MEYGSEFSGWAKQIGDLTQDTLQVLQNDFEKEYQDEDEDELLSQRENEDGKVTGIEIQEEYKEREEVLGKINFANGTVFQGNFKKDLSKMEGKLYLNNRSCKCREGRWVDGRLEGRVRADNEYGGWEVSYYKQGVKHGYCLDLGPYVHFSTSRADNVRRFCLYKHGRPVGKAYRGTMGGGFIIGSMYESAISDRNAVVVFPGHRVALRGIVMNDEFVRGVQHNVLGVSHAENGLLLPRLSPPLSTEIQRRDVNMWTAPLLGDPSEHERVQARCSGIDGAGEGLFTKKALNKGDVVALMNGLKSAPTLYQDWSDYRIKLDGDSDIDIPEDMRSVTEYCATLAHKANHSFTPNCKWGRVDHPRFGLIISLVALRLCVPGEEVTVNYRYRLCHAPEWYRECHKLHYDLERKLKRTIGV